MSDPARPAGIETAQGKALEVALAAGQQIATTFSNLTLRERLHVVSVFRRQLLPRRKPGRELSSRITAAHAGWKTVEFPFGGVSLHLLEEWALLRIRPACSNRLEVNKLPCEILCYLRGRPDEAARRHWAWRDPA